MSYEGYSQRYLKNKQPKNHISNSLGKIISQPPSQPNTIGNALGKITERVDGIQIKMVSLCNVVKLLQKYTEAKDQQYEKQKQNIEIIKNLESKGAVATLQVADFDNKVKQVQSLTKRMKSQLSAVQSLKVSLFRQSSQKNISTNPRTNNQMPLTNLSQINELVLQMEDRLRDQLNRKVQICINTFKALSDHHSHKNIQSSSLSRVMLEQQIHNITLNMNKIEAEYHKNINKIDEKVEEISYIVKKSIHSSMNTNINNIKKKQSLTPKSNSQQSVRKSVKKQTKLNNNGSLNIGERKRIKQEQLIQAIRKKKQVKQKLKVK